MGENIRRWFQISSSSESILSFECEKCIYADMNMREKGSIRRDFISELYVNSLANEREREPEREPFRQKTIRVLKLLVQWECHCSSRC